ncbi:MAG: alpha/beta hydrolase [Oscillospiraceae bacterium]|nr:alpha/beta hydrolase [Oscillospiraceae bacterium]
MVIHANGIDLYYEKTGQGSPVVLLHGNGEDHTIFDGLTRRLSESFTVYAVDSRDHGRSSSVKTLYYSDMMEDTAALIRGLNLQKPALYGFSDGGIIGLLLAIQYPDMLSGLIVSGANTHPDGIKEIFFISMKLTYFFTRSRKYKLMLTQPDIAAAGLNTIVTPVLVLAGSRDIVKEKHTKALAANIPGSVLRILERESHASYVVRGEKLYGILHPFLIGAQHGGEPDKKPVSS